MQGEVRLTTQKSSKHSHEEDLHFENWSILAQISIVFFLAVLIGAIFALGGIVAWEVTYKILRLPLEVAVIAIIIGAGVTVSLSVFAGFLIYRHHKSL